MGVVGSKSFRDIADVGLPPVLIASGTVRSVAVSWKRCEIELPSIIVGIGESYIANACIRRACIRHGGILGAVDSRIAQEAWRDDVSVEV